MTALEALIEAAERAGADHGKAAGSWVIDGNTSAETASHLLRGMEDGDPEVMDALPTAPLSGEWADSPTPASVLATLAGTATWDAVLSDEDAAELLDVYEAAFHSAVEDEVTRAARAIVD